MKFTRSPIKYLRAACSTFFFLSAFLVLGQDLTVTDANSGRSNKSKEEHYSPNGGTWTIRAAGVSALPTGNFKGDDQLAGSGLSLVGELDKYWGGFGLGLQGGFFNNPVEDKLNDRLGIYDVPRTTFLEKNKWVGTYFGFGPSIRAGSGRFHWLASTRVGLLSLKSPVIDATGLVNNGNIDLIIFPEEKFEAKYISAGTGFSYKLGRSVEFYMQANYMTAFGVKPEIYTYQERVAFENNGIPGYQETELIESRLEAREVEVNPTNLHLNAGLSFVFGKKKKKVPDLSGEIMPEREVGVCFPVIITSPVEGKNIYAIEVTRRAARTGRKPEFHTLSAPTIGWTEDPASTLKADQYIVQLTDEQGQVIYQAKTTSTYLAHNEELDKVYYDLLGFQNRESAGARTISISVASVYSGCETQRSKPRKIKILKNGTGLDVDFRNIRCDNPAYDSLGKVHYVADLELSNDIENESDLEITNLSDIYVSNTAGGNVSLITLCPPLQTFPLILQPGDAITLCIRFSRDINDNKATAKVDYYDDESSVLQTTNDTEDLPGCICNICDDWRIVSKPNELTYTNQPGANAQLVSTFNISSPSPIMEVKAEIVYVERRVSDPLCESCITHDEQMGLMTDGTVYSKTGPGAPSPWASNGAGDLYDEDSDGYGNLLTWTAGDPAVGVNGGGKFTINLNLPGKPALECCTEQVRVCVRWTFTDVDCVTCDRVVCYSLGKGGKGTGGSTTTELPNSND